MSLCRFERNVERELGRPDGCVHGSLAICERRSGVQGGIGGHQRPARRSMDDSQPVPSLKSGPRGRIDPFGSRQGASAQAAPGQAVRTRLWVGFARRLGLVGGIHLCHSAALLVGLLELLPATPYFPPTPPSNPTINITKYSGSL